MNTSQPTGAPDRRDPLVDIAGVTKHYDGGTAGLHGISLAIERGESVAVLGPSGSGKSTLLNLIAGLDRPSSGTVTVAGVRIDALGEAGTARFRRARVGMVFQFFNLLDDLTALDNVLLPAQLAGVGRTEAHDRGAALLSQLGIGDLAAAYPGRLSGGERQRVAIARALVNRPELLLADEPTGALDSAAGQDVAALLRDINRHGQTVVLVTHDRSLARSVATRTLELVDGRVTADLRAAS
ncbi:MAG TPA: ABC transporter ATP-binding protein [Nakamurella sp.]|nr:ABC transporter ATP-binding protein [Nakamurella sp.]